MLIGLWCTYSVDSEYRTEVRHWHASGALYTNAIAMLCEMLQNCNGIQPLTKVKILNTWMLIITSENQTPPPPPIMMFTSSSIALSETSERMVFLFRYFFRCCWFEAWIFTIHWNALAVASSQSSRLMVVGQWAMLFWKRPPHHLKQNAIIHNWEKNEEKKNPRLQPHRLIVCENLIIAKQFHRHLNGGRFHSTIIQFTSIRNGFLLAI